MRLDPEQFWTYSEWLFQHNGLLEGGLLALVLALLGFVIGYAVSVFKHGPSEGFLRVSQIVGQLFTVDLPKDRKSTRLNSRHSSVSRMPSFA